MRDAVWIITVIGMLGVTIACLGLLGITIFTIQSKSKEISIRKVIGATPASLMRVTYKIIFAGNDHCGFNSNTNCRLFSVISHCRL
jgi:uncharacterized protein with PQ loop repeat